MGGDGKRDGKWTVMDGAALQRWTARRQLDGEEWRDGDLTTMDDEEWREHEYVLTKFHTVETINELQLKKCDTQSCTNKKKRRQAKCD